MEGLRLASKPELQRGGRPGRKLAYVAWENAGGRNGALPSNLLSVDRLAEVLEWKRGLIMPRKD